MEKTQSFFRKNLKVYIYVCTCIYAIYNANRGEKKIHVILSLFYITFLHAATGKIFKNTKQNLYFISTMAWYYGVYNKNTKSLVEFSVRENCVTRC